jgi:hypothetical protein
MSRLQEELQKRQAGPIRSADELKILERYEERVGKFQKLFANKDFAEYLKLEEEMNDPRIVIAYKCSDPQCESLKAKIRDFWNRQRVLAKLKGTNGTALRTHPEPHRASR